jgi:hypothetical protein
MAEQPLRPLSDVELYVGLLGDPHGGGGDVAQQWLLAHPDEAHPELLRRLEAGEGNPYAVLALLPRFGRGEAVPALERVLQGGSESLASAAGAALAAHPSPAAKDALERCLTSPRWETAAAAADGLMARGDPSVCPGLEAVLSHPHPTARYHLVQAAARLGCLGREDLQALGREDPEAEVRALCERLLGAVSPEG